MADLRSYLLALSVGLLVGLIYALLNVRSPAPPVIALVGLAGILLGEQAVPLAKRLISGEGLSLAHVRKQCGAHVFGFLPTHAGEAHTDRAPPSTERTLEGKT